MSEDSKTEQSRKMDVREHEQTLEKPEIVNIYGTACIENSPFECVAQEELDSMMRFIMSKEHLKLNILHVEFSNLSTRQLNGGRFNHIIGLKLSVKTTNLWETPRSYVYRHIGQDTWERGNGSSIRISRIHQK